MNPMSGPRNMNSLMFIFPTKATQIFLILVLMAVGTLGFGAGGVSCDKFSIDVHKFVIDSRRCFLGRTIFMTGALTAGVSAFPLVAKAADTYSSCVADCLRECYLIADPKISPKVRKANMCELST